MVYRIRPLVLHSQTRNVAITTASEELSPQVMMTGTKASDQLPMVFGLNKI